MALADASAAASGSWTARGQAVAEHRDEDISATYLASAPDQAA